MPARTAGSATFEVHWPGRRPAIGRPRRRRLRVRRSAPSPGVGGWTAQRPAGRAAGPSGSCRARSRRSSHPDPPVLGGEERRELLPLDPSPVSRSVSTPRSMVSLAARMARRRTRELAGPRVRLVVHRRGRHDPVDQADRSASSALTKRPVKMRSLALLGPTRRVSRCVPPAPGMTPSRISGCPRLRVVPRDPEVRAERQLAAAAERVAGDRGDDRLGDPGHRGERGLQVAGPRDHVGVRHVGHLLDVRAGREDLLAAVHDHGPHVVAARSPPWRRRGLLLHWTFSAFIGGRSSRIVPTPSATSSRTSSPIGLPLPLAVTTNFVTPVSSTWCLIGNNGARDPRHLAPRRARRSGPAATSPSARPGRRSPPTSPCTRRGPPGRGSASSTTRAPRPSTRSPSSRWASGTARLPGRRAGHPLRLPGGRAVGAGAGAALQPSTSCCWTRTRGRSPARSRSTRRSSARAGRARRA